MSCCPLLPFTAHYCCNGHNELDMKMQIERVSERENEKLELYADYTSVYMLMSASGSLRVQCLRQHFLRVKSSGLIKNHIVI